MFKNPFSGEMWALPSPPPLPEGATGEGRKAKKERGTIFPSILHGAAGHCNGGGETPSFLKGRGDLAHFSSVFEEKVPALPVGHLPQELFFPHKFQGVGLAVGWNQTFDRYGAPKRCRPSCPARLQRLLPSASGEKEKGGGQKPPQFKGKGDFGSSFFGF
ncbi:hypothetical protein LJB68_05935 [bacterium 210820-DFI.6.52]|nr:hypothetical protein [bacterium 210820-DFI.6.52]